MVGSDVYCMYITCPLSYAMLFWRYKTVIQAFISVAIYVICSINEFFIL